MRIGGAFPPGLAPIPITLGSGSSHYPAPGTYYVQTDASSVVQWFDQQSQIWRTLLAASSSGYVGFDGFNQRILNYTGQCSVASFTAGSGQTNGIGAAATGTTFTPSANGTHGRLASLFPIIGGSVNSTATITNAGSGLLVPPLLICSPPPLGGIPAQFICTIALGVVDAVTNIVVGAGYTAAPTITVIPQLAGYAGALLPSPAVQNAIGQALSGGNAAAFPPWSFPNVGVYNTLPVITANATLTGTGTITGVGVIDGGGLYTSTPTITVAGPGTPGTVTLNAVTTAATATVWMQPIIE